MKKVFLSMAFLAIVGLVSCKGEAKKETASTEVAQATATTEVSFGVRGNCAMCKMTIEKAANSVAGVSHADWDVEKKTIAVSYDASKANEMDIHHAIANSGYDTEKMESNKGNYSKLPGCCQYDHTMEMNQ
ncbi:heavy-metal-associated domain-containing protein [Wenyingzhuangia aestuarii]|uniref:heavy-metal-associated domain-containing protein n=1 Tax=Wenyingzhuangia aestuarii TaxID=1647582 RepID=UPI00143CC039|nr:heavy-metal-associated domain-containing protein [Wenyingzhuangia aestuarii]NJB84103.1 copper chaperone CopZ [Wenyingzhuangia aestuarii]